MAAHKPSINHPFTEGPANPEDIGREAEKSAWLSRAARSQSRPIGRRGVLTLTGFGIKIRMQSGHLEIEDGIGPERRRIRLARIGHNLKRLVCISEDGYVSLSALKWLAGVGASFTMLSRTGRLLFITGPTAPSDVRLRRSQALAHSSGSALLIARELIDQKLAGQGDVARHKLLAVQCADKIHRYRSELAEADTIERVRLVESLAAAAYWSAWRTLPIRFPRQIESRLPAHWKVFGTRVSPLTGSPRTAVNPPNAMLNFLFALLESESSLAAAVLGMDPALGVLHVDTKARNSLSCDLMEAVRWHVEAFLLDWIMREPLKREWFFEMGDGNCRLTASFATQLSQTAPMWGRAVAPFAEWVTRALWSSSAKLARESAPATRLTQQFKREAKGAPPLPRPIRAPRRDNICRGCGKTIQDGRTNCASCAVGDATKNMLDAAKMGRQTANGPEAQVKRASTQRKNALGQHAWKSSDQPVWLTEKVYSERVQPVLAAMPASAIARRILVSRWYAGRIREGYRPHPRHWQALAELVGVSANA
jgi:CRISPR-associated endonuclease Cas1